MKLFLDSANLDEIKNAAAWGVLDGVTTNPTLLSREAIGDVKAHLQAIAAITDGPVSMEVIAQDAEGMLREGRDYHTWAPNIVVKIPMTAEGLKAVRLLKLEGIPCNVTLIFSANQALLAAKAGARYVSPFIGRLDENGEDGLTLIEEIVDIFDHADFETEILAASIRHPRQVTEVARLGSHVATLPFPIFEKLIHHPMTDLGLARFLADWKKLQA